MIWLRVVLPKDVETLFGQKFGCCSVGGGVGKGEVNLRSALGVRGGGWIEGGEVGEVRGWIAVVPGARERMADWGGTG